MTDATIRAYADALFPADGPIPISGSDAGAVKYMRKYLARCQPRQRRLVKLLIVTSELGPLIFGPRRRRFTLLSRSEQQTYIARGYASPIYLRRVIVLTMRALLTMAYFADDAVLRAIGQQHDRDPFANDVPVPKVSGERLKNFVDEDDALDGVA
jgi:hypothetical protein